MSQISTIAVTGATGFVGREIVRRLLASGFQVRALARDAEKARSVLGHHAKLTVVTGHVHDGTAPKALLTGCQACIHLIGILRETHEGPFGGQTFQRMHIDATKVMLDAAEQAGCKRFVHMSALGVNPDGKAEYQRSKFAAELLVRRSAMDWTIFRPGIIHGLEGELTGLIQSWVKGKTSPFWFVPFFTRMVEHDDGVPLGRVSFEPARVAPVTVQDVAEAFVRCLNRPQTVHEIYNLVGSQELTFDRMLKVFSDNTPGSANLPILGLPGTPHVYVARVAKVLGMGNLLPFDEGMPAMAQVDTTADLSKLRAHLEINPAPFEPSAKAYLASSAAH